MKQKKKEQEKDEKDIVFYDIEKVASMNECTGLTPALPQTDAEAAHYAELLSTHRSKTNNT